MWLFVVAWLWVELASVVDRLPELTWTRLLLAVGLFAATFVTSLLVIGTLLVQLPPTFFLDSHPRQLWPDHHPVVRWAATILKNLLGVTLIVLGAVLSLPGVPGQGLLTILVGLVLLDFPGKRRLERAILRRPAVLRRVNHLRARFDRPALLVEEPEPSEPSERAQRPDLREESR
jgi:hypothetical protein